ncbi:MAG TPA: DUF1805 domain-containing protein [Spirochaetota bacterium]|nr:DUF1805 domain-containing protein [Spirochaetota bacterium]
MPISIEGVKTEGAPAQGLSVMWDDGQFVVIVLPKGIVGCAAIDVAVMEEFDMAVATAHGTPQAPLVVPDDLIAAKISGVTKKARAMGIREGMTGGQAVEIMAGNDPAM